MTDETLPPTLLLLPFLIPVLPFYLFVMHCRRNRKSGTFAFFHPYCDAGGGGERVLWRAIYALQQRFPKLKLIVYTGDVDRTPEQIIDKARSQFNICLQTDRLQFVYLHTRWLLEAKNYPRVTMLGQMLAGLIVGGEALWRHCPEWFIDTTGCPMILPLFRWIAGSTTFSYVHYPTITTEMIQLVDSRTATYNNSPRIAASYLLTKFKLFYYRAIAFLYRLCGNCCQMTMANGSWTASHIVDLWSCQPRIVFPPCDVERLCQLENKSEQHREETEEKGVNRNNNNKPVLILSVGQIRPEKNHLEQLRIFAEVRRLLAERKSDLNVKLVIAGGCRHQGDQKRVEFLKNYARGNFQMESGKDVDWELNVPYARLLELMQNSMIGLHTMWNEHFGISVVEGMAAGLIMVAHNSGGPKLDIIGTGDENETAVSEERNEAANEGNTENEANTPCCGFLASTREEYASAILRILLDCSAAERQQIRHAARQKADRFSDHNFDVDFCDAVAPFLLNQQQQPGQQNG